MRGCLLSLLLGWAAGCGDDADGSGPVQVVSVDGCDVPRACDIARTDCAQAVLALTACERGEAAPSLPAMRTLSRSVLATELLERARTEAEVGPVGAWDSALRRLRLLPSSVSSLEANVAGTVAAIAAYYDPETQRITILEEGDETDQSRMYVLSHELTHYLQDRAHPLGALLEDGVRGADHTLSLRALIEGEATVNSTRVLLRLMGRTAGALQWGRLFDTLDDELLQLVRESGAPLSAAALHLPYSIGGRYVERVWDGYDREHVDALFDASPRAILDWLLGYGDAMPAPSRLEPLDCAPPVAPDGYQLIGLDSLGSIGAVALMIGAKQTASLAVGRELRADAIALYLRSGEEAGPESTLVFWRLRFRNETRASEVASWLNWSDVNVHQFGRELLLSAGAGVSADVTPVGFGGCPSLEELMPMQAAPSIAALRASPPPHASIHAVLLRAIGQSPPNN